MTKYAESNLRKEYKSLIKRLELWRKTLAEAKDKYMKKILVPFAYEAIKIKK